LLIASSSFVDAIAPSAAAAVSPAKPKPAAFQALAPPRRALEFL
jgi:hypothetical protein